MPQLSKLVDLKNSIEKQIKELLDPKRIEKQNAAFHRLSNKRQRIAIAKDVLEQIRLKTYVAVPGTYVDSETLSDLADKADMDSEDFDLQKALLGNAPECEVCGLGAAFCSMARLGDKVSFEVADAPHESLTPIFGLQQVSLIEYTFEGGDAGGGEENLSGEEIQAARRFYRKYPKADKRLAAIFRNIVKNDGTFKP